MLSINSKRGHWTFANVLQIDQQFSSNFGVSSGSPLPLQQTQLLWPHTLLWQWWRLCLMQIWSCTLGNGNYCQLPDVGSVIATRCKSLLVPCVLFPYSVTKAFYYFMKHGRIHSQEVSEASNILVFEFKHQLLILAIQWSPPNQCLTQTALSLLPLLLLCRLIFTAWLTWRSS